MTEPLRPMLTASGPAPEPIAAVSGTSNAERLEAFEDLIDRIVGDTMFIRARNLERSLGFGQLWLKFEGDNPTGTQKDRIAFALVHDALRRGFDAITVATCGNYGVAVALAAQAGGLACHIGIPERYHTKRGAEMSTLGAEVVRYPGTYEEVVATLSARAVTSGWYDANPGGANVPVQLAAYAQIAAEIHDQLRDAPGVVAVPMSNGTTLAGIHRGFVSLERRSKISRIPRFVGGSAWRKNPITLAFKNKLARCPDLPLDRVRETATNEPLINWRSLDGDAALHALNSSGGFVSDISDRRMLGMARTLRELHGLHVLPASTAGLLALTDLHAQQALPADRYVAVLTGRSS